MARGKLVFKGEEKKPRKAKKRSSVGGSRDMDAAAAGSRQPSQSETIKNPISTSIGKDEVNIAKTSPHSSAPKVINGRGLITTSGTVVTGHETNFQSQLRTGDAILAGVSTANNKTREEMRVITMVSSPISISLSSTFSNDLKNPTPFTFINKPRDIHKEHATKAQMAKEEQEAIESQAMGTYRGNARGEVVYREKTEHGGYRIRRERFEGGGDLDRSDLLNVRAKKKSDRYC
eukprot:CAMPEP_0171332244 /NCGR_PEP_ID=MMETSP0878-20121228/3234_1 /TAXON_ID=67004 /ORGANISM="Thalassiosira weissflogii, Strain CCMP1336" /LENGTH=232 /DNA_ID=CAMNT_0011832943 /DNA_START=280 /DNA_END=978 /DNA_ORIENTATION=+